MSKELQIGTMKVDAASVDRLRKSIRFLPEKVASRRIMVGMKRAMKPTKAMAASMAPKRSNTLAKAFHVVNGRRAIDGSPYVVFRVNPKKKVTYKNDEGASVEVKPKDYFHLVALGQGPKTRTTKGKGFTFHAYDGDGRIMKVRKIQHPGTEGQDIIGDAWKSTSAVVRATMLAEIQKAVNEQRKKMGFTT